jgi:hypothetical protein
MLTSKKMAVKLIILSFLFSGCIKRPVQSSRPKLPLEDYMRTYKFVPFSTPNNIMSPASIIKFNKGAEEVIAFPGDCDSLNKFNINDIVPGDIAAVNIESTINSSTSVSFVSYPELINKLNLTAAFRDSSVKKIKISLVDPFIKVIARVKEFTYIRSALGYCQEQVKDKSNVVISQVLGSQGLTFTFLTNGDREIKLSPSLLNLITSDADIKRTLEVNSSITISKMMYYGYRGFVGVISSGALKNINDIIDTTPEHINGLKNASR